MKVNTPQSSVVNYKSSILKGCLTVLLIAITLAFMLVFAGCNPEDTITAIQQGAGEAHYQATDPCSPVQVTAQQLKQMTDSATILVTTAAATVGFPYAKAILGALAVIQGVLALVLGWQKKQTQTALEQVVLGNEVLKKKLPDSTNQIFKDSQIAQSPATQKQVAKIRKQVAV